ncbi:MAG: outer membrane protein transport protein [Deltaproteobacteria bacterium]
MKKYIVTSLLLFPGVALGAGWSTTDQSVAAMGAGGAGAANAEDPGANTYNAAAGMMSPGLAASLGVVIAAPSLSATGDGFSAKSGDVSLPPHLHVRFMGERFGIGASVTVPFGSQIEWPEDWEGRFDLRSAQMRVVRASAFLSGRYEFLSFAVGPHFDTAKLGFVRSIDFVDTEGTAAIETQANGIGVSASVFARPFAALDVGLSYASRTKLSFEGFADFDAPPEFSGRVQDGAISTSVTLPDRFRLGARYRPATDWEVLADLELTLWSTVDRLDLDFASEDTDDIEQLRNWKTTLTPRVGARYAVLDFLDVRAGAYFDPSPVPSQTVGPGSPDSSRVGLTAGAGLKLIEQVRVDLGYQFVLFTGSDGTSESTSTVQYDGAVHLVGASVAARL